jgi:hypothetical protein
METLTEKDFEFYPGVYYPEDSQFVAGYVTWNRQQGRMELTTYWRQNGIKYRGDFDATPVFLGAGDATKAVDEPGRSEKVLLSR